MTVPELGLVEFTRPQDLPADAPLVVLGPALGTSVTHLYAPLVPLLSGRFHVVGWDLPGHGVSAPAQEFTVAELAEGVERAVTQRVGPGPWHAMGTSIGGAVVQQQLASGPSHLVSATLVATADYFPDPASWRERAELVASAGTPTQVVTCAKAWFAADFLAQHSELCTPLLHDLQGTDRFSYAAACRALADYDLRGVTAPAAVPCAVVTGTEDAMVGPDVARPLAQALRARCEIVDGAAHLVPLAAPELLERVLTDLVAAAR